MNITYISFITWVVLGLSVILSYKNKKEEDFNELKFQYILCWITLIVNLFADILIFR